MHIREGRALGSPLRLLVASPATSTVVDRAWLDVLEAFDEVDRVMSRFRADSELTLLNRRGGVSADVSALLRAALVMAERARRMTGARFDPRIVADLEALGFHAVPQGSASVRRSDEPVLRRAAGGNVSLSGPVDLGGLGKGLALRRARRFVAARVPDMGFLIDAGGDIATLGRPDPDAVGDGWSIALEDPSGADAPIATCELPEGWAIATSSTRLSRRLTETRRVVHHLLDPRAGAPANGGLEAVTVAFPDPAWAEVWTKDLFVEGAAGIAARARAQGRAAWWVDADGELSMTPAARQLTTWVRSEAAVSPRGAASGRPRASRPVAMGRWARGHSRPG